jgi:NDP-sugar pyrophosphorylase family protein
MILNRQGSRVARKSNSRKFLSLAYTVALILAGGRGSRLMQLTDWRAKPAVPFGGKFRIIDFPLSNCMNSGIRRIGVVTQYKSHSMIKHVQRGWGFLRGEFNEFVDLLPAQQRVAEETWYKGTADAVYQNLDILRVYKPEYVLLLAGDHVYKMDYGEMIANHVRNEADMTVACIEVPLKEASCIRRHGDECGIPRHLVHRKTGEPGADAGQAGYRAVLDGHLCVQRRFPVRATGARCR